MVVEAITTDPQNTWAILVYNRVEVLIEACRSGSLATQTRGFAPPNPHSREHSERGRAAGISRRLVGLERCCKEAELAGDQVAAGGQSLSGDGGARGWFEQRWRRGERKG
ncbi:hypothetical protein PanWU01x14_136390 [Parasponia andersonii]|uniref:Uncharacterized protein n=1 Tax=Parasponia andersonii TaxID=3476 RepID=A0A2P5CNW2_PARAD|nr:hypothetical protein PanWU01x14_136390 [Parasponia andersonii]